MSEKQIRVLLVDDEPNIVLALELLMKREGHEILAVDDGEKATAAAAMNQGSSRRWRCSPG